MRGAEKCRKLPIGRRRTKAQHRPLSEPQRAAIEMLALGKKLADVCEALSIGPRTLYEWRKIRQFERTLRQRQREIWSTAGNRLRAMLDPSLDVLEQQLTQKFEPFRYRAASAILRIAGIQKAVAPVKPKHASRRR